MQAFILSQRSQIDPIRPQDDSKTNSQKKSSSLSVLQCSKKKVDTQKKDFQTRNQTFVKIRKLNENSRKKYTNRVQIN